MNIQNISEFMMYQVVLNGDQPLHNSEKLTFLNVTDGHIFEIFDPKGSIHFKYILITFL